MAECFEGFDGVVRFSNGAVEQLYQAWSCMGEGKARTEEERAVLGWLRQTLVQGAPGARAFSLNPAPHELASPERLRFIAELTSALAEELAQGKSASLPEFDGEPELQVSWLARLMDLHALIQRAMPSAVRDAPLEEQLVLSKKLLAETQAERLLRKLGECQPPHPVAPPEARLSLLDGVLTALQQGGLEEEKTEILARVHNQRADVFLEMKNPMGAIAALRSASVYENDPELREANASYAAKLERELPRK